MYTLTKAYSKLGFFFYEFTSLDGELAIGVNNSGCYRYRTYSSVDLRTAGKATLDAQLAEVGIDLYQVPTSAVYINPFTVLSATMRGNKIILRFGKGVFKEITFNSAAKAEEILKELTDKLDQTSQAGAVDSVNGKAGAVVLTKADIELGNVDNTSDMNKPVSTATQAALDLKADKATTLSGYGITDAYTKAEVDGKLTGAFHYKGTVASESALPQEGNEQGDVYNVEDTGANYAWNGSSWDKLSETVDLSGYVTKESAADTYATKNDLTTAQGNLETQIAAKADASALNNYYSKAQVDESLAGKADKSKVESLANDVDYIGNTLIPEMNTNTAKALAEKVDWNAEHNVISLPKDGSISALRDEATLEGGNLIAQRTYDEGATFVTEVGTTKNKLTLNASERPQIDIAGGASEKVAYQSDIPDVSGFATSEELADYALKSELPEVPEKLPNPEALTVTVNNKAFVTYDGSAAVTQDLVMNAETIPLNADTTLTVAYGLEEVTPMFIQIPLRTLQDKVYDQETIIGWFGQEDIASIKQKLVKNVPVFVKYGISLSGNPHYYKFPAEYCAFESANQIKLVFQGLNTKNDVVSKYEILINLDGTIIEGNSNVKVTITSLEVDASTINYNELNNKPQINSIELSGNKTLEDLGIQPAGEYLVDADIANKADKATTLAGYGITDAYTKTEVDGMVGSAFHYKGSVANEEALPASDNKQGDVYNVEDTGANYAWDGEKWDKLSENIDLSSYLTKDEASDIYATASSLDSKVNYTDLTNYYTKKEADADFATKDELNTKADATALDSYALKTEIPDATSDLTNDSGFITADALTGYAETADLATVATSGSYEDLTNKPEIPEAYTLPVATTSTLGGVKPDGTTITVTGEGVISAVGGSSGTTDYTALTNKPAIAGVTLEGDKSLTDLGIQAAGDYALTSAIPTATSDLDNDSGFITNAALADYAQTSSLATVATSGSYNDLEDKPTIPEAYTLPTATDSVLGGIKVGEGLGIEDGVLSVTAQGGVTSVNSETGAVIVKQIQDSNTNSSMYKIWVGTKSEYDAIDQKDPQTLYYIQEEGSLVNIYDLLDAKQDVLTAGEGISIVAGEQNVISNTAPNVQADWNASEGAAQILNKPTLATVATTGSYNDLKDKPDITTQGNTFNGADQLVKLDSEGKLPAIDGSQLTGINIAVDYTAISNKPQINSIELNGNKSLEDLGIQPAGSYLVAADIANKADKATTLQGYGITDAYTKSEIDGKIGSVFKYKGSVANVGALPSTSQEVGDVYNVEDTGANYAWDGSKWDKLSETIDLSSYALKSELPTKVSDLTNDSNFVTEEVLSTKGFATTTQLTEGLASKANSEDLATVATTGSYNDLEDKPSIPEAYTLPTASTTELGGVKVDGTTITIADGVISAADSGSSYELPAATADTLGGIKVGSGLSVTGDGTLSAEGAVSSVNGDTGAVVVSEIQDSHTTSTMYKIWVGTKSEYDQIQTKDPTTLYYIQEDGSIVDIYDLIDEKQDKLTAGTGISITEGEQATIAVTAATTEALGGIKVGAGLAVTDDGTLSVNSATAIESLTDYAAGIQADKVYSTTITSAASFTLPAVTDTTHTHSIIIYATISTGGSIASLGTTNFYNIDAIPTFAVGDTYDIVYVYNPALNAWVCNLNKVNTIAG